MQQREIRGRKFTCIPFSWSKGVPLLAEIMAIKGDLIGAAVGMQFGAGGDIGQMFGRVLSELPQRIMDHGGVELMARMLATTKADVDGKQVALNTPINQDIVFGGDYLLGFQVLGFALEVNYAPFLGEVLSDLTSLLTRGLDKLGVLVETGSPESLPDASSSTP